MADEKSFEASKRKLERARREGNAPRSAVFSSGAGALAGTAAATAGAPYFLERASRFAAIAWGGGFPSAAAAAEDGARLAASAVAVPVFAAAAAATVANAVNLGLRFDWGVLGWKFDRVDPIAGSKRLAAGFRELPFVLLRVAGVVAVSWVIARGAEPLLAAAMLDDPRATVPALGRSVTNLALFLALIGAIAGGADLWLVRRRYRREQSMSLDELRREHKDEDGDPLVRSHRRAMHEALAHREIVKRVRKSKVVIVERRADSTRKR